MLTPIYTLLACWFLWVFYVAVMRLKQVKAAEQLTWAMKAFGYPLLIVGLALDLFVNVVVGSAVLLERPKEWTLSSRLWRLSNDDSAGWRQKVALAVRKGLLDAVDPSGIHKG